MQPLPTIPRDHGGRAALSRDPMSDGTISWMSKGDRKEKWGKAVARQNRLENHYGYSDALESRDALKTKILSEGPCKGEVKGRPHPADDQVSDWMREERKRAEDRAERRYKLKFKEWKDSYRQNVDATRPPSSPPVQRVDSGLYSPPGSPGHAQRRMTSPNLSIHSSPILLPMDSVSSPGGPGIRSRRDLLNDVQNLTNELAEVQGQLKAEKDRRIAAERQLKQVAAERNALAANAARWEAIVAQSTEDRQLLQERLTQVGRALDNLGLSSNGSSKPGSAPKIQAVEKQKQETSATKIQAQLRRKLAKKEVEAKRQEQAEAAERRAKLREQAEELQRFEQMRQERAAIQIQNAQRVKFARQKVAARKVEIQWQKEQDIEKLRAEIEEKQEQARLRLEQQEREEAETRRQRAAEEAAKQQAALARRYEYEADDADNWDRNIEDPQEQQDKAEEERKQAEESAKAAQMEAMRKEAEQFEREEEERERLRIQQEEIDRLAKEKADQEKAEGERLAKEKAEQEEKERERLAKEKAEEEARERLRIEQEEKERDRLAKEKAEQEEKERERLAKEKAEQEEKERERIAKEKAEQEEKERERLAKEKAEQEEKERERLAKEKAEQEDKERERLRIQQEELDRLAKEKAEQEALRQQEDNEQLSAMKEDLAAASVDGSLHKLLLETGKGQEGDAKPGPDEIAKKLSQASVDGSLQAISIKEKLARASVDGSLHNLLAQLPKDKEHVKKKVGYVGSPQLLQNEKIRTNLQALIAKLVSNGHEVTVGHPNKELADGTGAQVTDMSVAEADMFDAVLVAPGGDGAKAEAGTFAQHAELVYFANSVDEQYGKPEWLRQMAGDKEMHDLPGMNADDVAAKVQLAIVVRSLAEASVDGGVAALASVKEASDEDVKLKARGVFVEANRQGVLAGAAVKAKESAEGEGEEGTRGDN